MRILLIEDDAMIGAALSVALKDAAYGVDWVRDGVTAGEVLAHAEHQCVLLDLGLPGRDGMEVLRRLRQGGSTVPVIVITARDGIEERVGGWIWERTIIWSSLSMSENCWRVCVRSCGVRAGRPHRY